ncbi:hypothetical protein QQX98_013268 [Neonectria punicea]|uniref:Uncharacterized protein n=1 Tax=Neonectria punicea TaxID=979145 RepID=A0ABR1GGS9_9HYPO
MSIPVSDTDPSVFAQAASVDDIINGPIRDVFLMHAAQLKLCLYLQHRHHTVGADEAVVKVEGTAHLMDGQAMKNIMSFGNKVVPTTWMTSGGKILPMEFAVVPADDWSEMKIGDASVVVPSNDSGDYDQDKFIPVAFAFDEEKPTFRVHGKCGKDHKHSSKPK